MPNSQRTGNFRYGPLFYLVNFGVSLLLALVYGFIFHKRFDALVSKDVYKEKMSFEEANRIILEGMGSQFDPAL
ncbi:MAG: hypothetical protein IJU64_00260 [Bacilli bacterium]|nr:hypothetical protein [Bacilli bacterium]